MPAPFYQGAVMAISETENTYLLEVFQNIEVGAPKFSAWEEGFIKDQYKRHAEFEDQIYMSAKQWACVVRIGRKCGVADMSTVANDGPLDDEVAY